MSKDEKVDSSTTEKPDEKPTVSEDVKPQVESKPLNEYPRFKEIVDEKNELKAEVEALKEKFSQKPKPQELDTTPGFSPEGEKHYQLTRDRLFKEIQRLDEKARQERLGEEEKLNSEAEEFKKRFEGGEIPKTFLDHAKGTLKKFGNATPEELYNAWKADNSDADSRISTSSATGSKPGKVPIINRNEDFISAGMRGMDARK